MKGVPYKKATYYADGVYGPDDLAAVWNACVNAHKALAQPPAEAQPRGRGCGDHDHASYIPGCGLCAATLPEKRMAAPPSAPVGVEGGLLERLDAIHRQVFGKPYPTEALAQQPAAVDEAMVERALRTWFETEDWRGLLDGIEQTDRTIERMQAALTAALTGQQGGDA